jgi:hypothetical protein
MTPLRVLHSESVVPQAQVHLVWAFVTRLREANVNVAWVANLFRMASLHQCQRQSIVVEENDTALAALAALVALDAPQPEVFSREFRSRCDVCDGEVAIV